MPRNTHSLLTALLASTLTLTAAGPAIGFVQASGEFRLNQAATRGNGTLFDGSVLETSAVRSDVSLTNGGHLALAPNSKTRIFKDRAILETGAAEMAASQYKLIAAKLTITGSSAQVAVDSPTKVRVGAISSPVEVRNSENMLLARLNPGHALEFDQAGGASGPVKLKGTLKCTNDAGKNMYTITDETTNVAYEVQGKNLDKYCGKVITVNGSVVPGAAGVAGATVVAVSTVAVAAGAGAAAGLSGAAIAGVAIGGATAGILGGCGAAGCFSRNNNASTQ
jgi:hypothetical protein